MSLPLRVLIIEDSDDDAQLMVREIRRAGFALSFERVETAEGLERALATAEWDLVISDYALPHFSGLEALALVQKRGQELPFLVVSGAISDETAVAVMKAGAHDYVLKHNLARLGVAVTRELREAQLRRERRRVESELIALREQSAAELRRSRDQLEVILRGVAEGILAEDANGELVYANDAAAKANGYASTQAMLSAPSGEGLGRFDFWDEAGQPLSPAEMPAALALTTGQVTDKVVRLCERTSGEERWFTITSTPMFDEQRKAWMAITIFRNITEHKRAEATARYLANASEALASSLDYASTLAALAQVVVPFLADWCVVEVVEKEALEPRQVAAAHRDQAKLEWVRQLQHPPAGTLPSLFGTLVAGGEEAQLHEDLTEELLRRHVQDPEQLRLLLQLNPKSVMIVPLLGRRGRFGKLTLVAATAERRYSRDDLLLAEEVARRAALALENARLYRRAQQAIEARDEFLSIASHELRTPLTTLMLHLQRFQRLSQTAAGLSEPGLLAGKLEQALRQTTRLDKLIGSLLDVSRVTIGQLALQREEFDLVEAVQEAVERSAEDALGAGCVVKLQAEGPLVGVWDRLRIEQIVTNLLSNAYKYSPGRQVEVKLEGSPSSVRLTIQDHGIGIAARDVNRIFGRFERAVSARHYGGLGLGLFIARQIVDAHGGSIEVVSQPGEGARFTIVLPRALTPADTSARASNGEAEASPASAG